MKAKFHYEVISNSVKADELKSLEVKKYGYEYIIKENVDTKTLMC